jgi:hypothetical protein
MVGSSPLRCQKCGKLIGYISVAAKYPLETKPDLDNVVVQGKCTECAGGTGFYQRSF